MKINYPPLALAIGASGAGTTEFSPMGSLPVIARGVGISVPAVGMLISIYTVGIMAGTSLMTLLLSHHARRSALALLMAIFTLGNVLSVITPDYMALTLSRILTNLNYGAFLGLGSIVAVSVTPEHKQTSTVATMFTGLTLIDIGGVSAATWLGETVDWRTSFLVTVGLGVISMVSLFSPLPRDGTGARFEAKKELAVLMCPQALSALLATVLGAGTIFIPYTYISPVLQNITYATPVFITTMLVLIGVGSSIGNYLDGKLADCSVNGMLKGFLSLLMAIMLTTPLLARNELDAAISTVVWNVATFAVALPLQMCMTRAANEAPGLSSSANIGAFNLGNASGAAAGGVVISARLGYSFIPVMRVVIAGLASLLVFMSTRRQSETVYVVSS